jgi:hypothetical protein
MRTSGRLCLSFCLSVSIQAGIIETENGSFRVRFNSATATPFSMEWAPAKRAGSGLPGRHAYLAQ